MTTDDKAAEKKRARKSRDPLNEFLAEEEADDALVEAVGDVLVEAGSVTALLDGLAVVVSDDGDEIGAAKLRSLRVEYARHELAVDREEEE